MPVTDVAGIKAMGLTVEDVSRTLSQGMYAVQCADDKRSGEAGVETKRVK